MFKSSPENYDQEFEYNTPWNAATQKLLKDYLSQIPKNEHVLDLMCGTGYLLGQLKKIRQDLIMTGVDINSDFINFARTQYPDINFIEADVLTWNTDDKYDSIISTGGLHHLPYEKQKSFLQKTVYLLKKDGHCLIMDPYIGDYSSDDEKSLISTISGYEYIKAMEKEGVPKEIIKLYIDHVLRGEEFKTSFKKADQLFSEVFHGGQKQNVIRQIWPDEENDSYGICLFFDCKNNF